MESNLKYHKFNKKCLEYYIQHSHKNNSSFFIPPSSIQEWLNISHNESAPFSEFRTEDWRYFTKECVIERIPRAFGIIALQCYAAFLMRNEDGITENEYNIRLKKLFKIANLNTPKYYGSGSINNQDNIWFTAVDYLGKNHGIEINIPQRSQGAGRNVKYPKYQVDFCIGDFEKLHSKLLTLYKQEVLTFEAFKTNIYNDVRAEVRKMRPKDKSELEIIEQLIEQLYNYYNTYDWINKEISTSTRTRNSQIEECENEHEIFIEFDRNQDLSRNNFKVYDYNENLNLFDCINYIKAELNSTKILLYKRYLNYDCFERTNKFIQFEPYLIVIKSQERKDYLERNFNLEFVSLTDDLYGLFLKDGINDKSFERLLKYELGKTYEWIEISGIRTNFQRLEFLEGQEIEFKIIDESITIVNLLPYSNDKLSFKESKTIRRSLPPGDYSLNHKQLILKFSIKSLPVYPPIKVQQTTSLDPKELNYNKTLDGIFSLHYPIDCENISFNKHYRDIFTKGLHHQSSNSIIKALNKKYHGRN